MDMRKRQIPETRGDSAPAALQSGWFPAWSTPKSFCSIEQVSFVRAQSHHPKLCGPPVAEPGTWSECPTLEGTTVMGLTTHHVGSLGDQH